MIALRIMLQAWTSRESIHFTVPAMAGVPIGIGTTVVFMSPMSYMVDAYGILSASALGAAA